MAYANRNLSADALGTGTVTTLLASNPELLKQDFINTHYNGQHLFQTNPIFHHQVTTAVNHTSSLLFGYGMFFTLAATIAINPLTAQMNARTGIEFMDSKYTGYIIRR